MHKVASTGVPLPQDGLAFVEQTPAPWVFLTAADTDIQTLAQALDRLPKDFPALRAVNLLRLTPQVVIDAYAEAVLEFAQVIILRLLGGRSYWTYGLEVVRESVERRRGQLVVLPGDDRPDMELMSHSTVPLTQVECFWQYLREGGVENFANALLWLRDCCGDSSYRPQPPQPQPRVGCYPWPPSPGPRVGVVFYRAHHLAGNTAVVEALGRALVDLGLAPVPVYVASLTDPDLQGQLLEHLEQPIELVITTTGFSLAQGGRVDLWERLDVPVLQAICSGGSQTDWREGLTGLSPRDLAMHVVLPEMDGRITTRVISCKQSTRWDPRLETPVVDYEPLPERIAWVAQLASNWVRLRQTPPDQRRVALILANYPHRNGRLANGVGLDTPASCVGILRALAQAGYRVDDPPGTPAALIERLTQGVTNDPETQAHPVTQSLCASEYQAFWATLPAAVRSGISQRWGEASQEPFAVPGLVLGHVFVGIQPPRGYDQDPALNYHAPDLEPPHSYLAFYAWVRRFAQVVVHVGKHGNLEWLPGKSIALDNTCYPEVTLGPMPHLYPFIVNDPGEGAQAKRRAQAVILDHLTPPLTRGELYGPLQRLEGLIDEYYEAQALDPPRVRTIQEQIRALVDAEHLDYDLTQLGSPTADWIAQADGYLCELKEAQIRDGLHILGQCPQGEQLRDLTIAIARSPSAGRQGLTRALASDRAWPFDPLTTPLGEPWEQGDGRTVGDGVEALEIQARDLVQGVITGAPISPPGPRTQAELTWISTQLLPALRQTDQEINCLLRGLGGGYVPSGPAGAPTRGRPEVLPTGRNFYSVDLRALPTESAWALGRRAAEALIERYTQDQGEYPRCLGLSVWGTSTMRTGGDDLAQALALLGVQPVWDGPSRRVLGAEVLPLGVLGRPRVDVTLRISGFFRDAFPNLIALFNQAVAAVAALEEPEAQNPLAARVRQESQAWQADGVSPAQALVRAQYRVFGSKPGAYGAGLQGLIEAQIWRTEADLAQAYINWSSYAYGTETESFVPEVFKQRLKTLDVVLHNQDNREHDLLDSDDYYQFQGGLAVAARTLQGHNPQLYFGDHSRPESPRIRRLAEEIARVYRSRVVNPKWLRGVMRHGYKGAFELAATVDYLFAYGATTGCVTDHMYAGVTEAYLFDSEVKAFLQSHNPWALRDIAERLLEAEQRGLWSSDSATVERLRSIVHQAEGVIEGSP